MLIPAECSAAQVQGGSTTVLQNVVRRRRHRLDQRDQAWFRLRGREVALAAGSALNVEMTESRSATLQIAWNLPRISHMRPHSAPGRLDSALRECAHREACATVPRGRPSHFWHRWGAFGARPAAATRRSVHNIKTSACRSAGLSALRGSPAPRRSSPRALPPSASGRRSARRVPARSSPRCA